jgi:TPP-dependent pyruvate/acetoin dehydrogenase alpha subunit
MKPLISNAKLKQLYATMLRCRLLDERTRKLRRLSAKTAPFLRKEAAIVGAALDLRRDDWLLQPQNDLHARLTKGVPLVSILAELRQSRTSRTPAARQPLLASPDGNAFSFPIVSSAANPSAQLNLASGIALALQAAKRGNIVLAFCGDTSHAGQQWHEALGFAALHGLPLLIIEHTQPHAEAPSKGASTSQGKPSAGRASEGNRRQLPEIPVDANDVVAVYRVAYESIHKARHGGGPTLIQAISLPVTEKSGPGDQQKHLDAIARMEDYLATKGLFVPSSKQKIIDSFNRELEAAIGSDNPGLHAVRRKVQSETRK